MRGQNENTSTYGVVHVNKWIGNKTIIKKDDEHQTLVDGGDAPCT